MADEGQDGRAALFEPRNRRMTMKRQYAATKHPLISRSLIILVLALTSLHAQETARWKTLSDEARTAAQGKAVLRRLLENPGVKAISVAVIQDGRVVCREPGF